MDAIEENFKEVLTLAQVVLPAKAEGVDGEFVCHRLRTVTGVVKTGLESNAMQHIERRMATLENVVTNFCDGSFTFTPGNRKLHEPVQPPPRLPRLDRYLLHRL